MSSRGPGRMSGPAKCVAHPPDRGLASSRPWFTGSCPVDGSGAASPGPRRRSPAPRALEVTPVIVFTTRLEAVVGTYAHAWRRRATSAVGSPA